MRVLFILLISGLALCTMVQQGTTNVWKDNRTWSELADNEEVPLEVKYHGYLNFDFPDDGPDGAEWNVPDAKNLKKLMMIGQGHIYPSKETGTSIKRRTYSFQATQRGNETVTFVNAVKGKETSGKTYKIHFNVK